MRRSTASAVSAGAIGTGLGVVNIIVGFGFQATLAGKLGVDALADVFQMAWTIVTFMAVVQLSMVTSLLVPRLQTMSAGGTYGRSAFPVVVGVIAGLSQFVGAIAFADGDLRILLVASAPAQIFMGLSAVPQALAYISRRFLVIGIGPVANGSALLLVTLVRINFITALELGLAVTAGYGVQWIVTAVGTRDITSSGDSSNRIPFKLFAGVLAFTLISKFQPVLERVASYQLTPGATAALGYGQKIAQGLILFATFGIATAATASLARHLESEDVHLAADLLARVTLLTFTFGAAVCSLALPLAYPGVVILFQRGAFTADDSRLVAIIVAAQLPWVWSGGVASVLTSYLYVERRYAQVLISSFVGLAVTLLSALILGRVVPQFAVAIGGSAGCVAALFVQIAIMRKSVVWQDYRRSIAEGWRLTLTGTSLFLASCALYLAFNVVLKGPSVIVSGVVAAIIIFIAAAAFFFTPSVKEDLKEVMNARL